MYTFPLWASCHKFNILSVVEISKFMNFSRAQTKNKYSTLMRDIPDIIIIIAFKFRKQIQFRIIYRRKCKAHHLPKDNYSLYEAASLSSVSSSLQKLNLTHKVYLMFVPSIFVCLSVSIHSITFSFIRSIFILYEKLFKRFSWRCLFDVSIFFLRNTVVLSNYFYVRVSLGKRRNVSIGKIGNSIKFVYKYRVDVKR